MEKHLVLIVEDNKTIALYQQTKLKEAGIKSVIAHNKDELFEALKQHRKSISLAIVDINLPDSGGEALDYLLNFNIPSIAMTGDFHKSLRDEVIEKPIIDYIVLEQDNNLELLLETVIRTLKNYKTKILIVDDSKASRFSLKKILTHQNYTVHEASNGMEALNELREHPDIKIALIDYEMPKMTGAKLTQIIRKSYSRVELSILAISVHHSPLITIEFLKAGANDFITKPYVKEEVTARIGVNLDMINQHQMIQQDIEKRKHIEKLLEDKNRELDSANKTKSIFLANMSHEIRTPMNAIKGFIEILHTKEQDREKLKMLDLVKSSTESLLAIINDILDFSKIESNKMDMEKSAFTTLEPFEHVIELFTEKCHQKNIMLDVDVDKMIPPVAVGDTTRIKQIFSNILSNAIKFSDRDSQIKIRVRFIDALHQIECSVQDSGIGIAPENIEKIFSPFEQESLSTTRHFGGTGLGLSISKSLAQKMGGDIRVQSTIGKGSTFIFTLSIFEESASIDDIQKESRNIKEISQKQLQPSGKVMIVEDNATNQLLLSMLLDEYEVEYIIANDGLEAIELYPKDNFALILMDENMPNLNGIQTTQKIKQMPAYQKHQTPIVAVTANAMKEDKKRFLDAGLDDYITKPIERDELHRILTTYLGR